MKSIGMIGLRTLRAAAVLTAVASPALAQDVVRIASNSFSLAHGPLSLAAAQPEIFADKGITLEVKAVQGSSANCIAVLLSGDVDICQVGTTTGTDAIAEGAPIKGIAILTGPINEIVISKAAADASGVSPDAPVEDRVKALKGMRLVTADPGSPHYMSLAATLAIGGLTMEDVQFRSLLDVTAMIESIRNNQIDGALWSVGSLGNLLTDGSGVRWISMARGDIDHLKTLPYVTAYARAEWIEANPDLVARIHAGYVEAIRRLQEEGPASSAAFKAKYFPDLDQALWDDGFAQAQAAYLTGAKGGVVGWNQFLEMQAKATGKDYTAAAFETAVIPLARGE